jgi:hypothetical protein
MWGLGLVWLLFSVLTAGIGHILGVLIMPAISNRQYREHLATRGYRNIQFTAEELALQSEAARNRTTGYMAIACLVLLIWIAFEGLS